MNRFSVLLLLLTLLSFASVRSAAKTTSGSSSSSGSSRSTGSSGSSGSSGTTGFPPPSCVTVFDGSTPFVNLNHQWDTTQLRANWFLGPVPKTIGTSGRSTGSSGGSTGSSGGSTGSSGSSSSSSGSTGGKRRQMRGTTGTFPPGGTTGGSSSIFQVAIVSQHQVENNLKPRCRSTSGFKGNKADVMNFKTVQPEILVVQNTIVFVWKSNQLNLTKGVKYFVVLKYNQGGRTVYTNSDGIIVGSNHSGSEDDDRFPPYKAGLIAMGIAIFCLLCCLCLLILLVALFAGKKEDKYGTTVHRNENVDKL